MPTKYKYDAEIIKAAIAAYVFYQQELNAPVLTKAGWNDGGLCPFHNDTRPGSFFVNLHTGAFKCYSCDAGGSNIISFTMLKYNLSFYDALKKLATDWRVGV